MILTPKQERFCVEYLVDCNATQAAIRAGYSAKTARSQGQRMLTNVDIKSKIEELREEIKNSRIASAMERMEFLTQVMRGEIAEEVVLVTKQKGVIHENKKAYVSDRIKAAIELDKMDKSVPKEDPKTKLDSLVNALLTRYDNEE